MSLISTEISAALTYMPTKYLGSGEWESYWDLVVDPTTQKSHSSASQLSRHQPTPFSIVALDFSILFSFSGLTSFSPSIFQFGLSHTHGITHSNPLRASGLPADLECSGAEGCPVTSCPSTSPLPYSPLIYCKGQVASDRKMDATITSPFSAALSPCLFLMEIVGKKNLLLLSKSYQIFIRVIL